MTLRFVGLLRMALRYSIKIRALPDTIRKEKVKQMRPNKKKALSDLLGSNARGRTCEREVPMYKQCTADF